MGLSMYHQNEIAQALRMVVQGASLLTSPTEESDRVHVTSTRLFAPETAVRLVDASGKAEEHVVAELIGATEVRLWDDVSGDFGPATGARLQISGGAGAELKWVAQGQPGLMPLPRGVNFPAAVVAPVRMAQPANTGTNRMYQQEYLFEVHYFRQVQEGEDAAWVLGEKIAELFNLVMTDPYLEETCWHAQVVGVELQGKMAEKLREKQPELQTAVLEVLAKRSELWGG